MQGTVGPCVHDSPVGHPSHDVVRGAPAQDALGELAHALHHSRIIKAAEVVDDAGPNLPGLALPDVFSQLVVLDDLAALKLLPGYAQEYVK